MSQTVFQPLQNSWRTDYLLRRKHGPLGLKNLGNTCYFNSVLQCLTYTPPLANLCLDGEHTSTCGARNSNCAFCFLERRIRSSLTTDVAVDSPTKIFDCLQRSTKLFRVGRQEDAHELLRFAIEACNNACIQKPISVINRQTKNGDRKLKGEPHTVVKEIFGGVLQSQVKCETCGTESNKLDEIMDLSLDIMPRVVSLGEAMCRFFQPEILDGDNKYLCSKCKKPANAKKQLSVFRAPNVLVIQLKRFENIYGGKIDRHIAFDERLALTGFMCRNSKDPRPEYSLYGLVVHSGHSQDGGHYYAYVKEPRGKWYCCNDASVWHVSSEEVREDKAYMLFYVRNSSGPKVAAVCRNDSTPSPPNTPDTDVQEPPKKYSSPNAPHSKRLNIIPVSSRVNSKKQLRINIRNVDDPPEKEGREKQLNVKPSRECMSSTGISVSNQPVCSSSAEHGGGGMSPRLICVPQQDAGSSFDGNVTTPRCGYETNGIPNAPSQIVEDREQAGALITGQILNKSLVAAELVENSLVISTGAESREATQDSASVIGHISAARPAGSSVEETGIAGTKRPREEAQFSADVVGSAPALPLLDTQVGSSRLKSPHDDTLSRNSDINLRLEKETRDVLLSTGFYEKVRERLRELKRSKISHGLWPADQDARSPRLFYEEDELNYRLPVHVQGCSVDMSQEQADRLDASYCISNLVEEGILLVNAALVETMRSCIAAASLVSHLFPLSRECAVTTYCQLNRSGLRRCYIGSSICISIVAPLPKSLVNHTSAPAFYSREVVHVRLWVDFRVFCQSAAIERSFSEEQRRSWSNSDCSCEVNELAHVTRSLE
ncbi:hypothetical protein R1flu_021888 [Riccia fluitans]|uniref:Ubiquitin carboxyl-terminal hydrolase n=1 Tax=Riccia fluitans TaxID=41844 RepID=A0ABD1ZQM9_9MARC